MHVLGHARQIRLNNSEHAEVFERANWGDQTRVAEIKVRQNEEDNASFHSCGEEIAADSADVVQFKKKVLQMVLT